MQQARDARQAPTSERSESGLRQTTINSDLAACHEAAIRRRKKGSHRSDLLWISHTLKRSERAKSLHAFLAERCDREFSGRRARRYHVYPDTGALQVLSPGAREVPHCRLTRAIGAHCRGARITGAGAGQNNRPAVAHQRQRLLDREDGTFYVGVEGFVDVRAGDLAERELASCSGVREDDVEGAAL